jgi:hypothetical protein
VTPTSKALVGLAAACALCVGIGPTFAQGGGPIDPSVFTVEVVHPWAPFRSPNINAEDFDLTTLADEAADWDTMELWEVRARCSSIVGDPNRETATVLMPGVPYSPATIAFCEAVFAWTAENRPDAPNTWDAAQAAVAAAGN